VHSGESRPDVRFEFETVLLDVDGTLIGSNAADAEACTQSLHGVAVDIGHIRPLIGMGADKRLPGVASVSENSTRAIFAALLARWRGDAR
jgi:phosphoglycolate phosphatase-like HAD superfamily hydrolase